MQIINGLSHVDHAGVTVKHLEFIQEKFGDRTSFFIEEVEFPQELSPLPCGLYGPACGDDPVPKNEVVVEKRPGRDWPSRLIDKPMRYSFRATVIAGPAEGYDGIVLYTVYGGPAAPREPLDPAIKSEAERQDSERFWAQHALAR